MSPLYLTFSGIAGGNNPSPRTVNITNGANGTLSDLSSLIIYQIGGGWLSASLNSTTAPATLTVQPNIGGLTQGTYTATIRISSPVAGNSPQNIAVSMEITNGPRCIKIINNTPAGEFLDDVVQVKVISPGGSFSLADELTNDGNCWTLPQSIIPVGGSRTFDISEDDYRVFIGMGRWECDATGLICAFNYCWWKRTYTTDVDWNNYWVWVEVIVTGHQFGTWDWPLTGLYNGGIQYVTPAGNSPIPFNVTTNNPIPGAVVTGSEDAATISEDLIPMAMDEVGFGKVTVRPPSDLR